MTYRTRLIVLLVGLVVVINGLLTTVEYRQWHGLLEKELHRKARSIVSTAAALFDPEVVAVISSGVDQKRELHALQAQLQKIREFNRRKDVWIADLFTLIPAPQNPAYVEYGVDAEDRFPYEHHAGEVYTRDGQHVTIGIEGIDRLADRLQGFQAGFNSAFAPIRDNSGKLIAMLGVRLTPAPYSTLNEIGRAMAAPFVATVALALIMATLLGRAMTRPLANLRAQLELIGKGDLDGVQVPAKMSGEFIQMAAAIAAMARVCANATGSSVPSPGTFPARYWKRL